MMTPIALEFKWAEISTWNTIGVYLLGNADVGLSLHSPNREVHIPTRTVAVHPQKLIRISKSSMVEAIKVHLIKLLGAPTSDVEKEKI
jgi:hypothetical protein